MSAALARQSDESLYSPEVTKTPNEPRSNDIFSEGFEQSKKPKQALLNYYWRRYKGEFREYMEKQVNDGKLSERRFKDYWNGLNRFFKQHKVNGAIDFLRIHHITDAQVKGLKKFFKFLKQFKYKEIDLIEITAMNEQVKVKSSPKMQGKPAKEETMKQILSGLTKKDYRYYLYKTLIYTGGRLSQIFHLLQDISNGKVTERDLLVFGDIGAFDITKYAKGRKPSYFAIMPLDFAKELLENKELFNHMPSSEKNIQFLKEVSKKKAGASNIRDWFFNKALYQLEGNKTNINFIQSRQDEKGSWQNYPAIREALKGAVKEYRKLTEKGMFNFLSA